MTGWRGRFLALSVIAGVSIGCGATPVAPSGPVRAEDRDGGFLLTITSSHRVWGANQPISVGAELTYLGPGTATLWGPAPGPHVAFGVVELTGKREMPPIWLLACGTWKMTTRVPLHVAFNKSGGYSDDEPDGAFYQAYLDDPEFRLPAGKWEVSAYAPFSLGDCGGDDINLEASVTLTVQ